MMDPTHMTDQQINDAVEKLERENRQMTADVVELKLRKRKIARTLDALDIERRYRRKAAEIERDTGQKIQRVAPSGVASDEAAGMPGA